MTNMIVPTLVVLAVLTVSPASGQEVQTASLPKATESSRDAEKASDVAELPEAELPEDWQQHPLGRALVFASKHDAFIRNHVRDFSCVLAKRERLNGRLHDYEYLRTFVRRAQTSGEQTVPFSVYTEYLAPKKMNAQGTA